MDHGARADWLMSIRMALHSPRLLCQRNTGSQSFGWLDPVTLTSACKVGEVTCCAARPPSAEVIFISRDLDQWLWTKGPMLIG